MDELDPLMQDLALLGGLLEQVVEEQHGRAAAELPAALHELAVARRGGDPAAGSDLLQRVGALSEDDATLVTRCFSLYFELANLAEDRHRVRVLRERERADGERPRAESIAEAIQQVGQAGWSAAQVQALLDRLDVEPVFTAHPTEAKRRTGRTKLRRIRELVEALDSVDLLPRERERLQRRLLAELTSYWQTDMLRESRPSVLDEVRRGLYFAETLWQVVPQLYDDLGTALSRWYPEEEFRVRPFLHLGSWIGGDRDGNPNVTAEVTAETLLLHRRAALAAHIEQCRRVAVGLTASERQAPVAPRLKAALEECLDRWPQTRRLVQDWPQRELYRRWLVILEWRLEQSLSAESLEDYPAGAYRRCGELVDDLQLLVDSLLADRGHRLVEGDLADWVWQARVFGFHIARLDIRQESRWNAKAMAELLRSCGACGDYLALNEAERQQVLTATMPWRQPILLEGLSDAAREALSLFRLLRRVSSAYGDEVLGGYVISLTHHVSDVLTVLWLGQWAELGGDGSSPLRIVPLFETIADLHRAPEILAAMLDHPVYAEHLRAQGGIQQIMVGYSDSTKDGGYLAANWALYEAQAELHAEAARRGVRLVFFHGRGGSLGRGGGPAARGIEGLPPQTVGGGLRVTEQGEVLADRYDDPRIALRHLEQLTSATMRVSSLASPARHADWEDAVARLSEYGWRAYRELVETPGFVAYFEQATPLEEIVDLPIGSRPARRRGELSLQDLRAIPWVFSWVQSRHLIPAWYGLGSAFARFGEEHGIDWDRWRAMYHGWTFFTATIDNAVLGISRTDLGIARHYADLVEDPALRERIWSRIRGDYDRSIAALREVTERDDLLADVPWLERAMAARNPYVDVLNLIQIEGFRRLRGMEEADRPEEQEALRHLLRLTIQGVASGMRTTG